MITYTYLVLCVILMFEYSSIFKLPQFDNLTNQKTVITNILSIDIWIFLGLLLFQNYTNYKPLGTFLQDGPQCGLVALAMCLGKTDKTTIEMLYESAKEHNYTYNGEMFSAYEMFKLARQYLPVNATAEVFNGDLENDNIKHFLLDGGMILVPYDTDKDNSPGFHKGHKAHWAVVSGGVLTEEDFFVLARHGKARNVAVWRLATLANSNKQLLEFSPDRKKDYIQYKLPKGGICGPMGLNNKSVLITGMHL